MVSNSTQQDPWIAAFSSPFEAETLSYVPKWSDAPGVFLEAQIIHEMPPAFSFFGRLCPHVAWHPRRA